VPTGKAVNEKFDITIPVEVIYDPSRDSNSLLMRVADTESSICRGKDKDEQKLGYAGAAMGGTLIAGVGEYVCIAKPIEFWKAVKDELEKRHEDVLPKEKEDSEDGRDTE
jgi:hypothetical protein